MTATIPVSREALEDGRETSRAIDRWLTATPDERAAWARKAAEARAVERTVVTQTLTMEKLLDKLGFSREYAEHLIQPYCHCGDSRDGWDYCQHARDLGLTT